MSLRQKLHEETGSALIAAVIILVIILGLGGAVLFTANVETHQTGTEASGEAAFNVAEGALDAEADLLQQSWPSSPTSACNQASTPGSFCPGTSLTDSLATPYAGHWFTGAQWTVQIVDDSNGESPDYYTDSAASSAPSFDSDGGHPDNKVWIRAQAIVGGQKRIVVAEMVRQVVGATLAHNVITAGGAYTSNRGNKIIVESKDTGSGFSGQIAVRCGTVAYTPTYGDPCAGWDPDKGQLDPANNYQAGDVDQSGSLSPGELAQLKQTAQANRTYYNGVCPTNLDGIVYVDNPPGGNCTYNGGNWPSGTTFGPNGATSGSPGALIFGSGTLYFNGNINYYGVVYMVNAQGATPSGGLCTTTQLAAENEPVFEVHGNASLWGSVFVDKCGQVDAGDSAGNINYISSSFSGLSAYAAPELAKNTFQIIPNS
jgi:Tfp pilus assembly protein PilX